MAVAASGLSNFFYTGNGGVGGGRQGPEGEEAAARWPGGVFILNTFCAEVGRPPEMRMARLLGRAIRCIVYRYFLPASVAISATAMVTETAAWSATMTAESSATGISVSAIEVASVEVAATGVSVIGEAGVGISMVDVSTTIGISTIDISTIDISTIDISAAISIPASVVFALKTPPIKATAIEISGIPSFEKRPIVGIVGIIPIVTVPDRIVVVRIPGELSCKGYTVAVGIPVVGVGVGALICRIGLLIYRSGSLVNAGWGWYLRIAPGGDEYAGGCQGGECKDLFHFVCDFKLAGELLFRFAHPGYKKANGAADLTRVC